MQNELGRLIERNRNDEKNRAKHRARERDNTVTRRTIGSAPSCPEPPPSPSRLKSERILPKISFVRKMTSVAPLKNTGAEEDAGLGASGGETVSK